MIEINIKDLAPYNEYDSDLNGGFYNCPECNEQNYVSESYENMISECCKCFVKHKFIE